MKKRIFIEKGIRQYVSNGKYEAMQSVKGRLFCKTFLTLDEARIFRKKMKDTLIYDGVDQLEFKMFEIMKENSELIKENEKLLRSNKRLTKSLEKFETLV